MNEEEVVIKKLKEYSSECHTQLAYSINGYKKKHPGDLRLCMYETDVILNYIKDLQHQLEEKDKIISEAINFINMIKDETYQSSVEGICDTALEILERGKNGK